jgi:hypothetical protein
MSDVDPTDEWLAAKARDACGRQRTATGWIRLVNDKDMTAETVAKIEEKEHDDE